MALTFDIVPYPVRDSMNDTVAVSQQQATTIDTNFARINTDLAGPPNVTTWASGQVNKLSNGFVTGGPFGLGALWPAFTVAVPAKCSALIIELVVGLNPAPGTTLGLFCVLTGPGITSLAHEPIVYAEAAEYAFNGATAILPPSRFNTGKVITVTPSYWSTYTGDVGDIQDGVIYVTAMR